MCDRELNTKIEKVGKLFGKERRSTDNIILLIICLINRYTKHIIEKNSENYWSQLKYLSREIII